ncbi:serine/threonine protein kinase [Merismopedia glauca CCAP 1448/3]|uniref:non-specific serine/threonine protein kinase n=1 Tax=Merismopedia glauca CCAP 1448/3 TaxID=1296344 RepID=A0A2T1C413_9CYAN|nr:serine/threonine protein kinase [Merismopedia glauca CCAP 1448/3]
MGSDRELIRTYALWQNYVTKDERGTGATFCSAPASGVELMLTSTQNAMIGKILRGRYRITSYLGGGEFAETYLAQDEDIRSKPLCVVKRLKVNLSNPQLVIVTTRLFQTEAEVLYHLQHPQIPRLLADFMENGEFYLVQEYIDGEDLSKTELAFRKSLTQSEVIQLLQEILEVLAFVHQQKIIHRDIKPSNLIRRRSDGKLFLIDFGAVKQIQGLASETLLDTDKVPVGTIGYMPDEQAMGYPQASSDIYAVGITAIQALTGISVAKLPRDPNNQEIIWQQNAKVSPKLAQILSKMVRYDPDQRYHSAVEALEEISTLTKPKIWLNKFDLVFLGGAIAFLLLGTIFSIFLNPKPKVELNEYTWSVPDLNPKISLKYPKNWKLQPGAYPSTPDVDILESPQESSKDTFNEQVIINVETLKNPILLDEYSHDLTSRINQNLDKFQLLPTCETDLSLGGGKTQAICYQGEEEGIKVRYLLVVTLRGNQAYYLTYRAEFSHYNNFLNTAKDLINSVKFIE